MEQSVELSSPAVTEGIPRAQGRRRRALARVPLPEDLLRQEVQDSLERLARRMRRSTPSLKLHEHEDMVQQATMHALANLHKFDGRCSFRTWVVGIGRNRMIDLGRRAKLRPKPASDEGADVAVEAQADPKPEVREKILEVVSWLRDEGRRAVPFGAEVLTFSCNGGGDLDYAAARMTTLTGSRWTAQQARAVLDLVRSTGPGSALCASVGIREHDEEEAA